MLEVSTETQNQDLGKEEIHIGPEGKGGMRLWAQERGRIDETSISV